MVAGGYLAGMAFLLVAVGCAGFAALCVCRRRLVHLTVVPQAAAIGLLTMSALALAVLLPGALGILTRGTFVATAVALAAVASFIPAARSVGPSGSAGFDRSPAMAITVLASLIVGAWGVGELVQLMTKPPLAVDFISYDLPVIGRWIQAGSVWHITELFPLQTHGTYPQTADLVLAGFVLPFHNDGLVGLVPCLALGLTGLAAFATARELNAPRSTALACAVMFCAVPTVAWEIQAAPPDALALAAFTIGLMFLLRHVRSQAMSDLVMAGLGLGFAAGSLWYFTSAVGVIAVVWIVGALPPGGIARSESWRQAFARAAVLVGTVVLVSGFWLLRNLVETGDPVYPVRVAIGGETVFAAPPDLYRAISGFSIAHYLGSAHVLRHYILPGVAKAVGLPGLVLLLGLALGLGQLVARLRRGGRPPGPQLLLLVTSVLLVILYVLTPYSAFGPRGQPLLTWVNVRYLIPAIAVALPVVAVSIGSAPRRVRGLLVLAACAAVVQGIHEAFVIVGPSKRLVAIGVGVELVVVALVGLWWTRGRHRTLRATWGWAVGLSALAALVLLGYASQRHLNSTRYAQYDPTFAWIQQHHSPLNVGLAGSFDFSSVSPAWPMFGERIQNTVAFVGPLRKGHLTQYRTRQEWLTALRRAHDDVVEIAVDRPPPFTNDNEPRWAAASHLRVLARSPHFELVRAPS